MKIVICPKKIVLRFKLMKVTSLCVSQLIQPGQTGTVPVKEHLDENNLDNNC